MRLFGKIIFILTLLLFLALVVIYIALQIIIGNQGKAIVIEKLENAFHKKVAIGSLYIVPLFNLEAKDVAVEGIGKARSVYVSPSITTFFTNAFEFNTVKIVKPEFVFEKASVPAAESQAAVKDTSIPAIPAEAKPVPPPSAPQAAVNTPLRLLIKHLLVKEGVVHFTDKSTGSDVVEVTIKDMQVNIDNFITSDVSMITNFDLTAKLPWQKENKNGRIEAEGWCNLFKKDMQAKVKLFDIDAIAFYPYYSTWVDKEKARIEKAKLNFTSTIQGQNNDVVANCRLELAEIVFRPRGQDEPKEKAERIAFAVLDILKTMNAGNIFLDFTIKTKMDKPKFNFSDIKMAFENKLMQGRDANSFKPESMLQLPGKLIEGTFKGATDLTKGVISGTISAGKEIKGALEDSFRKEPKEIAREEVKK